MTNPKISVIIPVYNVEKYLRECLDSVINQTLKDIEIICINDGSTDKSLEILEEYKNKNRITILTQSNSGAGVARNNGLKVANGEYIAFLDGDDFYKNDFCEKMYNKAKENNADIVVCSANSYNSSTKVYKTIPEALKIENLPQNEIFNYLDMPENIFNTFHNWNWNKIFRIDFIKNNNNLKFQELFRTNDLYFTCTALVLANKITTINEQLVNYRIDNYTSSQATNYLYPLDFIKAFLELRKFLVEKDLYEKTNISYLNWLIDGCLYNINSQKNQIQKKQIIKSIRKNVLGLGLRNLSKLEKSKLANYKILYKMLCPMSFFNIRENIFSINDDYFRNKHMIITILGIKIKMKRGNNGK